MVTSVLHYCCGEVPVEDPHLTAPKAYSALRGYSQSKIAKVGFFLTLKASEQKALLQDQALEGLRGTRAPRLT